MTLPISLSPSLSAMSSTGRTTVALLDIRRAADIGKVAEVADASYRLNAPAPLLTALEAGQDRAGQ
jgi:hypothetical protein